VPGLPKLIVPLDSNCWAATRSAAAEVCGNSGRHQLPSAAGIAIGGVAGIAVCGGVTPTDGAGTGATLTTGVGLALAATERNGVGVTVGVELGEVVGVAVGEAETVGVTEGAGAAEALGDVEGAGVSAACAGSEVNVTAKTDSATTELRAKRGTRLWGSIRPSSPMIL